MEFWRGAKFRWYVAQKPSEPVFIPALGWRSFDPKGSIVLSVVFDQPRKLTSEQVNRISVRDHCRLWRVGLENLVLQNGGKLH